MGSTFISPGCIARNRHSGFGCIAWLSKPRGSHLHPGSNVPTLSRPRQSLYPPASVIFRGRGSCRKRLQASGRCACGPFNHSGKKPPPLKEKHKIMDVPRMNGGHLSEIIDDLARKSLISLADDPPSCQMQSSAVKWCQTLSRTREKDSNISPFQLVDPILHFSYPASRSVVF
jgi:hypothetical protein